jgi:hypothetical protein
VFIWQVGQAMYTLGDNVSRLMIVNANRTVASFKAYGFRVIAGKPQSSSCRSVGHLCAGLLIHLLGQAK